MKIKHQEINIPQERPFENCKLNREPYAKVLTEIVGNYPEGFVLAINNEWGTGKTTFVKMWEKQLSNEGFQTIYFNAWENDFDSSPLVALMSELKPLIKGKIDGEAVFKSVVEKGAILVKNVVPSLTKSILKRYGIDIDEITSGSIENSARTVTEILQNEIDEYAKKKKTIADFRSELEKFILKNEDKKPLIFIIDELDRCRPNYAVEVLEQMKHFFCVNGIVFVLSIDKKHLASSVKGFYGSEQINADEYLRRFIDLEYLIPKPSSREFCRYLFDYYSFHEFFGSEQRRKFGEFQADSSHLLRMAEFLFATTNVTLRQQEKIFGLTRLIMNSFKVNEYTFSHVLFLLVYMKVLRSDLYAKIESNTITVQQLSDAFGEMITPHEAGKFDGLNLIYVEALLLHFYNNSQEHRNRIQLVERGENGNHVSFVRSKLDGEDGIGNLANGFISISHQWNYSDISLKYLLNKINLVESVEIK